MTIKNKYQYIGRKATISLENGLKVEVKVLDFKNVYGRERWLVEPVSGAGQAWVENVKFYDPKK